MDAGAAPAATPDRAVFTELPDLASRRLGGSVVAATDELFAERENLIKPDAPAFSAFTFGHKGQVYDGWETRRRREPGHDHAIVRLGAPGIVHGVVIDTSFFVANHPPTASVEGCAVEGHPSPAELETQEWVGLVPRSPLTADAVNAFAVDTRVRLTHIRLSIYPDGGVARLRVHGDVVPDPRFLPHGGVDLAAAEHGGRIDDVSDMHYASSDNLIAPGLARVMGEGWETARRRDDGNDWVVVALAGAGVVDLVELDTSHFVGNAPGSADLHGWDARRGGRRDDPASWTPLLARSRLQPDTRHRFRSSATTEVTHVRLDIHPDGGMARVRLYGRLSADGHARLGLRWLNAMPDAQARRVLRTDAGLDAGQTEEIIAARPVHDPDTLPPAARSLLTGGVR